MICKKLSIVIPCYNEEAVLSLFFESTRQAISSIDAEKEYIFVDDGSKDGTLKILRSLAKQSPEVNYISLSRNFGKEAAIFAGLTESTGDLVVLMDADLQHPPALIRQMFDSITERGHDSAAAKRVHRKGDPLIRRVFSNLFFRLMQRATKTELIAGATDFRMMTRQMVDAVLSMAESSRFTKGIFGWVGFDTEWITYEDVPRAAGQSKWPIWSLISYSANGIISFSTFPLTIASGMGLLFCVLSLLLLLFFVIKTLIAGDPVPGFPTLICVIFLLSGIQLLFFGVMGQYMAKIFLEVKNRPIYIAKERNTRS